MMISELNKSFLIILLLSFGLFAKEEINKQKIYSISDLKVLNNQGKHIELFEHLYDVIPSKRDQTWQTIFHQALSNYSSKTQFTETDLEVLYRLSINPDIKSKNLVKTLSDKLADELVEKLNDPKTRIQANIVLKKFLEHKSFHFTKSFNIGEKYFQLGLDKSPFDFTWELISKAMNSNVSEMYCDQPVAIALLKNKLDSKNSNENKSFETLENINEPCWQKFTASLYNNIDFKGDNKDNLLKILLSSGLKDEDKHYLNLMYLLNSQKDKELTNLAWNSLKHLRVRPEKRSSILKKINKLDPLPDLKFKDKGQATLSFINQLSTSFPEYINHYLKTCYQYISGIKDFKMGNPTINCRELVRKLSKEQIKENIYAQQIRKIFFQ